MGLYLADRAARALRGQVNQKDWGTRRSRHESLRTGDIVLFTCNTALRFLLDSPYSHVGLVVNSGTMLFHTTPDTQVPRAEPLMRAINRALTEKRLFRRAEVVVRRMTMPEDLRERAEHLIDDFVAKHGNHVHAYSAGSLIKDITRNIVLMSGTHSMAERYCSGLVAMALQHADIIKRWWCNTVVLPCHFGVDGERVLEFSRGCAMWPPVSIEP